MTPVRFLSSCISSYLEEIAPQSTQEKLSGKMVSLQNYSNFEIKKTERKLQTLKRVNMNKEKYVLIWDIKMEGNENGTKACTFIFWTEKNSSSNLQKCKLKSIIFQINWEYSGECFMTDLVKYLGCGFGEVNTIFKLICMKRYHWLLLQISAKWL